MTVPKWWKAAGLAEKELFNKVRNNFQNCEPLEEMGIEVYQLARLYYECFNENIPVAQLGFSSLGELIFHCDDILQVRAKPAGRLHIFLKRDDGEGRSLGGFECLESSVLLNVFSCVPDSPADSSVDLHPDGSTKVRPMRRRVPWMELYVPPSRRVTNSNCPITRSKKIPPSAFIHEDGSKVLGLFELENVISRGLPLNPRANPRPSYNLAFVDAQGLALKDGWNISWNEVISKNCVNSADQPILVPAQRPAAFEECHGSEASELPTPGPHQTSSDITKETGKILGFDTYGHLLIRFSDSENAIRCVLKGSEELMYVSEIRSLIKVGQGMEAEVEIHQSCHPFFLVPLISITSSAVDGLQNGKQWNKEGELPDHKFQESDKQKKIRHFLLQSGYISFGLKNLTKK